MFIPGFDFDGLVGRQLLVHAPVRLSRDGAWMAQEQEAVLNTFQNRTSYQKSMSVHRPKVYLQLNVGSFGEDKLVDQS